MEEVKKINEDARFVHFMTEEEDRRKMENTRIAIAKEEGKEEGINLGREEGINLGKEKKLKEIIAKMRKENFTVEMISKITGETEEKIQSLLNQ